MTDQLMNSMQSIQSEQSGGDTMPRKPRKLALGNGVSLREIGPDKFELRTRKPNDAKQILFCSWSEARSEAVKAYENVTLQLEGMRVACPTISRALNDAIANGRGKAETVARYTRDANRFMEWLPANVPGIQLWSELRPSHLKLYLKCLEERKLARDTIRQAMLPVQKASKFWAEEYPRQFDEIAKGLKLPAAKQPNVIALPYDQLQDVIAWLQPRYPHVCAIASLAGFMGLRLREAAGILNEDLDLVNRTLTIKSNEIRELKNETFAPRVIPITEQAMEAIASYRNMVKIRTMQPNEPVFTDSKGNPWTPGNLGNECRNANKRLKAHDKVPDVFCIRKLRSTFNTLCFNAGAREAHLQRYMGQTPTTVGRRHYLEVTLSDLKREVTDHFEKFGKPNGNSEGQSPVNQGATG